MSDTAFGSGIAPRFTPQGARELIDDIDLLLDHLGRAMPGRLEACFDDSRGNTARGINAADPPMTSLSEDKRSKAAFIKQLVDIACRATSTPDLLDAKWEGFGPDVVFLIQARDFLATLVYPATVDTIRLTRAFVDETANNRGKWWVRRRSRAAAATAKGKAEISRNHAEMGTALALRMRRFRKACFASVILTALMSLYALTGKFLLDDKDRTEALLGQVMADIDSAVKAEVPGTRASDLARPASAAAAFRGRVYCDQPFLDDEGVVHYASDLQRTLCTRLWGVNGYRNSLSRQFSIWKSPFAHSPLGWLFGVRSFHAGTLNVFRRSPEDEAHSSWAFAEHARLAEFVDARALAEQRAGAVRGFEGQFGTELERQLAGPEPTEGSGPGAAVTGSSMNSPPVVLAHAGLDPARIMKDASAKGEILKYRPIGAAMPNIDPTTGLQSHAVLQGLALYLMPCLYALLGAFVAVFRNIARKSEAALLDRADHDRAMQTLTLGVVFGAVIGLLAEMLRAGDTTSPATGSATIALGVSTLALLAGYSVGHVFGLLDNFSERVFGRPGNQTSPHHS